jgi:hypothetical protein
MSFFQILRESNLDWNKARDIFYNLTDYQIAWLNEMYLIEQRRLEEEHRKAGRSPHFAEEVRSFDLRQR